MILPENYELINIPMMLISEEKKKILVWFGNEAYTIGFKSLPLEDLLICSAEYFPKENRVVLGPRHHNCLMYHNNEYDTRYNENGVNAIGGFWTYQNTFVNREEAVSVIEKNNIRFDTDFQNKHVLFSEDFIGKVIPIDNKEDKNSNWSEKWNLI